MRTISWLARAASAIVGALVCALIYWWLWSETGVYAWFNRFLGIFGRFGERWTFVAVLIVWILLVVLVFAAVDWAAKRLNPSAAQDAGAGLWTGMLIVPLVAFVLALTGTVQGIIRRKPAAVPLTDIARSAGWMPRNVQVDGAVWKALDRSATVAYASDTSSTAEVYVPITGVANPTKRPIFLKAGVESEEEINSLSGPVEGTLAIEPLTARARLQMKKAGQEPPLFAIVLHRGYGVLGYWIAILLVHLVPFGVYGLNRLFGRATPPASPTPA